MTAAFAKYHALGNDMIVIDPETFEFDLTPATIRLICQRHFGLGGDGICYGPLPESDHPRTMRFFNPDGTEAEKSGNGLRIFARYLWDRGYVDSRSFDIQIGADQIETQVEDEQGQRMTMRLGHLTFASSTIPVTGAVREVIDEPVTIAGRDYLITAASIGNPHCVIFEHDVSEQAARTYGPVIERANLFPARINVQFARVIDRHTIAIEIWERGAGYTLASGTSSCAAAGAAVRTGRCDTPVEVRMVGGSVKVAVDEDWRATLTGSVTAVAAGTFASELVTRFGS